MVVLLQEKLFISDFRSKRSKCTHSGGTFNSVQNKNVRLIQHICRKVSNDAHLVNVALTVNL